MFRSVLGSTILLLLMFTTAVCAAQKEVIFNVNKNQQLITIDDYDGDGWHPRSITKSAQLYYSNRIDYFNKYIKENSADEQAYYSRGIAEFRLQKYDLACKDFEAAIKLNPALYQAYYYRGFAKFKLGDRDGALEDCNKAIDIKPCDTAYRSLGVLRAWMRNFSLATEAFTKAIELNSSYVDAYVRRGRVEGQMKKYDVAQADFAKAIALDSNYAEAYIEWPYIKEDLNEFDNSIAISNKAIQLDSNSPQAFINRGWGKEMLHQSDSAIVDFNRAIELAPGFSLAYSCRCVSKEHLGDLKGALRDCNKAVKLDTTSYFGYGNRTNVRRLLKDYKGAKQDYLRWMAIFPKDSDYVNLSNTSFTRYTNDVDTTGNNPGGERFLVVLPIYNVPENGNHIKTDLEDQSLQDNVKTIHETPPIDTNENYPGTFFRPQNLKRLFRFNEYGYCIELRDYSDSINIYVLNDSIAIRLNSRGQQIEFTNYDGRNHVGKFQIIYAYDNLGRIKEKTERDLHLGSLQQWQYNDAGDEISGQYIAGSKVLCTWITSYQHNEKGKKTQAMRITHSANETDTAIWEYDYNNKGDIIVSEVGCYGGLRHTTHSEIYDSNNRCIRSDEYRMPNDHPFGATYDKYGNPVTEGTYLPNGKLKIFWKAAYEYDSKGNWTKRTTFNDDKADGVTTRVIEYY